MLTEITAHQGTTEEVPLDDNGSDEYDADEEEGEDPELAAIEHIIQLEEAGAYSSDETLSPKGMDQAERNAGLRDD